MREEGNREAAEASSDLKREEKGGGKKRLGLNSNSPGAGLKVIEGSCRKRRLLYSNKVLG